MHALPFLMVWIAGATPPQAPAQDTPEAELDRAIALSENFQLDESAALLHKLLEQTPPSNVAAKAHVYLALIAMNTFHPDEARSELMLALRANPGVELPLGSPPKAALAFAEAQERLQRELRAPPPEAARPPTLSPPAPPSMVVVPVSVEQPSTFQRYHVASWVLIAASVAAAAVGIYGATAVVTYNNDRKAPNGSYPYSQLSSEYGNASFWADAWIPVVAGAAVAGGAAALAW